MVETLKGLANGTVHPMPQDHTQATLAPILTKDDGRMDFSRPAGELFNRLRGFRPWPGAFTTFRAKTLQVHLARPAQTPSLLTPAALTVEGTRLLAGCGLGSALELLEVQIEGKRRMTAQEFMNGYRPKAGERLGE
jgi:methionyl-tRNA formyltransferase